MNSIPKASDENAARVLALFQELLNTLPPGSAMLASKRTKNNDGTIIWLKPFRRHAAEFCVHIEDCNNCIIDVSFGAGTTFELPAESKLPESATFGMMLEAVRKMGLATIAGRCREYLGFIGIRGSIDVGEAGVLVSTSFFHPRLIPKLMRYEPYV